MTAEPASQEVQDQISSVLLRLEQDDEINIATTVDWLRSPSIFTVQSVGKENFGEENKLYYCVNLAGRRGGEYVAFPIDRPSTWSSDWVTPELFHFEPSGTISTRGSITYVQLERGEPDRWD